MAKLLFKQTTTILSSNKKNNTVKTVIPADARDLMEVTKGDHLEWEVYLSKGGIYAIIRKKEE